MNHNTSYEIQSITKMMVFIVVVALLLVSSFYYSAPVFAGDNNIDKLGNIIYRYTYRGNGYVLIINPQSSWMPFKDNPEEEETEHPMMAGGIIITPSTATTASDVASTLTSSTATEIPFYYVDEQGRPWDFNKYGRIYIDVAVSMINLTASQATYTLIAIPYVYYREGDTVYKGYYAAGMLTDNIHASLTSLSTSANAFQYKKTIVLPPNGMAGTNFAIGGGTMYQVIKEFAQQTGRDLSKFGVGIAIVVKHADETTDNIETKLPINIDKNYIEHQKEFIDKQTTDTVLTDTATSIINASTTIIGVVTSTGSISWMQGATQTAEGTVIKTGTQTIVISSVEEQIIKKFVENGFLDITSNGEIIQPYILRDSKGNIIVKIGNRSLVLTPAIKNVKIVPISQYYQRTQNKKNIVLPTEGVNMNTNKHIVYNMQAKRLARTINILALTILLIIVGIIVLKSVKNLKGKEEK